MTLQCLFSNNHLLVSITKGSSLEQVDDENPSSNWKKDAEMVCMYAFVHLCVCVHVCVCSQVGQVKNCLSPAASMTYISYFIPVKDDAVSEK